MSKASVARVPGVAAGTSIAHLRRSLEGGSDWPSALLEAMAMWTIPQETCHGRRFEYFIGGEAFDWMLLAERLFLEVSDLVPRREQEDLLFAARFPASFQKTRFKDLLGVEKYRGALNFYYGVTVEEALQLTLEAEVRKRQASNGVRYKKDYSDEVFLSLYRATSSELLQRFRDKTGGSSKPSMDVGEHRSFTYWLFKHRLEVSDKARVASDTKKGLEQLQRMKEAVGARGRSD